MRREDDEKEKGVDRLRNVSREMSCENDVVLLDVMKCLALFCSDSLCKYPALLLPFEHDGYIYGGSRNLAFRGSLRKVKHEVQFEDNQSFKSRLIGLFSTWDSAKSDARCIIFVDKLKHCLSIVEKSNKPYLSDLTAWFIIRGSVSCVIGIKCIKFLVYVSESSNCDSFVISYSQSLSAKFCISPEDSLSKFDWCVLITDNNNLSGDSECSIDDIVVSLDDGRVLHQSGTPSVSWACLRSMKMSEA